MPDKPTDVFISYSREDQERVVPFAQKLRDAGVEVWIDRSGIDGAANWSQQIVEALDGAKAMLLMISPASVRSDNVAKEVTLISERKGHILPLHLERTTIPASLKYPLAGIQHIELFDGDPEEHMQAILRSLSRLGVRISPPTVRAPASATTEARGTAESTTGHALAVLPFENLSPDPEAGYFSDGLTEELISKLSSVSEIELVSRWATMKLKGQGLDPQAVGAQLGARYVIGGSVRKQQNAVRITVQLVDVSTNRQIWGETYKGELADIFDIQEQVAQKIVDALKLKVSFSEKVSLTKRSTVNAQAYDLYLRAQDYLYRLTRRSNEYAIQLFEKAIELDPRFAAAYAGASCAYGMHYQWFDRSPRNRDKAQELSFKALMYDSGLAQAYSAMGLSYFTWGKFEEATASCMKAIELDPDDFVVHWTLGRIHFSKGEAAEAGQLFRKVTQLAPNFYTAYTDLRQAYLVQGLKAEAAAVHDKLRELLPLHLLRNPDDARARLFYAGVLNDDKRRDEALVELRKAAEVGADDPLILYNLTCLYTNFGDKPRALDTLREAIRAGYEDFGWMLHDPDLAPLREDPAFGELKQFARGPAN